METIKQSNVYFLFWGKNVTHRMRFNHFSKVFKHMMTELIY